MEYIGRAPNREAKIVVDANDDTRVMQIAGKEVPGRCRFQRLPIDDLVFRRGRFSRESGFWVYHDGGPTDWLRLLFRLSVKSLEHIGG